VKHREGELDFSEKKNEVFDFWCTKGGYCFYQCWRPARKGHVQSQNGCSNTTGHCSWRCIMAPDGTLAVWDEEEIDRSLKKRKRKK
jgi:hypothetical protein